VIHLAAGRNNGREESSSKAAGPFKTVQSANIVGFPSRASGETASPLGVFGNPDSVD
jgi:hypothetical protein